MTIVERSLQALEWPALLRRYSEHCRSAPARERALALDLAASQGEAEYLLECTAEAYRLLDEEKFSALDPLAELTITLKRLAQDSVLDGAELWRIQQLLAAAAEIQSGFAKRQANTPLLEELAGRLWAHPPTSHMILSIVDPGGTVKDSASPKLGKLRQEERHLHRQARERLEEVLQKAVRDGFAQDNFFDVRDGKYLIPLKSEHRTKVAGLVYETSGSRASVYVEPSAVREINDRIAQAQQQIEEEIFRILEEASRKLRPHASELEASFETAVTFDLALARGSFARHFNSVRGASRPVFTDSFYLDDLYHPLLAYSLPAEKIVRNTFHLDENRRVLIISGPNTGGKTVLLKAVGLAALMARAGFFVPAAGESKVPYLERVLAQIGDEQSLEMSLSSFSASIVSLKEILAVAASSTLVLIDEILHSTDPDEAAALSRAILDHLSSLGAFALVTTHLNGLKVNQSESYGNASMEFDAAEMAPTYKLRLGIPGSSRALEISERLGLSSRIVEKARAFLGRAHTDISQLLQSLEQRERELDREKEELRQARQAAELEERQASSLAKQLQDQRRNFLADAKEKLRMWEREALAKAEQLIDEYKSRINDLGERQRISTEAKQKIRDVKEAIIPQEIRAADAEDAPAVVGETSVLKKNGAVFVRSLAASGILLSAPADRKKPAEVLVGKMKLRVEWNKLAPAKAGAEQATPSKKRASTYESAPDCPPELNLLGKRVEEALVELENYLDRAARSGRPQVRVVHGFGTGALRGAVRDYLKNSAYPIRIRSGEKGEGGDGCTVVEFNE